MAGLQFRKLDLHTHTPASRCYRYPKHTAAQIVAAALEQGLDAIAVTDHNTAAWIGPMKAAAVDSSLVIFPGVEISMSEGFHLVALFDPATEQIQVENFLGAIDIQAQDYGHQEALCTRGIYEVINKINERNGLAILAHIDDHKGAFREMSSRDDNGQIRVPLGCRRLFNEARYHAVECRHGRLPDGFDKEHQFKRFPAVYQASDNPDPEKPTRHSLQGMATQYSWFNLDRIDLEGLRQCFADPEVRIRTMAEYTKSHCPQVVSLKVGDQGFLKRQTLTFHNGLNSIIGGKGVGKSLAVELIRFGLGQPPEDASLLQDHLSKLDKRLVEGNDIEIVYQLGNGSRYLIKRRYDGRSRDNRTQSQVSCLNLETGESYSGDVAALFPVLAYSQTEVIKIAENKNAQLELIDRFIDRRSFEQTIARLQACLRENDGRLAAALEAQGHLLECEHQIATLQAQIDNINQTLRHTLFDQMKEAESRRAALGQNPLYLKRLSGQIRQWLNQLDQQPPEPLPRPYHDDEAVVQQQALAAQTHREVTAVLSQLAQSVATAETAVQARLAAWLPEFESIQSAYAALLRESGGDRQGQERQRQKLETQKRELEQAATGYRAAVQSLDELQQQRTGWLNQFEVAHRDYYQARQTKFEQLAALSEGKLQLLLDHAADRSAYEERLVELLRGGANAPQVSTRRQVATAVAPRHLVEFILNRDSSGLAEAAAMGLTWAERIIEKLWSHHSFGDILALQHDYFPRDVPSIRFRKQGGRYEELGELSVGQKCTALLIIALCDGDLPVIIDQPEDALDIVSVWEDVAKKLRRGKKSRQFILTTHNSSVAVAADSDQFIVLRARADYGQVTAAGAIDRENVRQAVINHLEGGKEPYLLRLSKYNIVGQL
jgi:hypothetical protein